MTHLYHVIYVVKPQVNAVVDYMKSPSASFKYRVVCVIMCRQGFKLVTHNEKCETCLRDV